MPASNKASIYGLDALGKVSFKQGQRLNNLNPDAAEFGFILSCMHMPGLALLPSLASIQRYLRRNVMA